MWKKELYFVKYSISKFMDFFQNLEISFQILKHFCKKPLSTF